MRVRNTLGSLLVVFAMTGMMAGGVLSAFANSLPSSELQSGWLRLFDGSLRGWETTGNWQTKDGVLISDMRYSRTIVTRFPLADFLLKFDYRLNATPSGAALRIRESSDGKPDDSGYRIPLSDSSSQWPAGSIVNRVAAKSAPVSLNTWHSMTVEADGSHIKVEIDGHTTADIHDQTARAGYIGFESTRGVELDLRNLRIKPLEVKPVFDGVDLSGWKNVSWQPPQHKGFFHALFGSGSKPHNAAWSVRNGAMHGENGPGAIETSALYDNFVLQFTAKAQADAAKKNDYPTLYVRNQEGTIGTGYPLGIGAYRGEIGARTALHKASEAAGRTGLETVIADGRAFYIFLNGTLSTIYRDTRPEAASVMQGARTQNGSISLEIPRKAHSVDVLAIAVESLPQSLGGMVGPLPPSSPVVAQKASALLPKTDAKIQTEQLAAALGIPSPQTRSRTANLMSRAISSTDPREQMQLYDEIIKIDPGNTAALQGYKEAEQKLEQQQTQQQQQQQTQLQQAQQKSEKERQLQNSLTAARAAFLGGHLSAADRSLQIAERIAPSNPMVRDLRQRIDAAESLRRRLLFVASAASLTLLLGGGFLLFRRRKSRRYAMLEVVQGIDQGRRYPLDSDVVRIGAIAEDRGQKNDIVVRDVEHMVSRFHCEVIRKDGRLLIKDVNSSNGTRVDGEPAPPGRLVPLRKRARIDLGGTVVLRVAYERRRRA